MNFLKLALVLLLKLTVISAYDDDRAQEWLHLKTDESGKEYYHNFKIATLDPYNVTCTYTKTSSFFTKEDATCKFPNSSDAMILTGTMESRNYCGGANLRSDNFTCDLRYIDRETFLFNKFFDHRFRMYGIYNFLEVNNARSLNVVIGCSGKHRNIHLNNIGNVNFIKARKNALVCPRGEFLGYNITVPDFSGLFGTIKLWRSNIDVFDLPNRDASMIYFKHTYVDTLRLSMWKRFDKSARKRNSIDECVIKTVDKLITTETLQVTNSTIGRVKTDSSRLDRFGMHNVTIDTIDRHGLTFLKSATLMNSTIRNVLKYGILFEPEHPITVHLENIVIDNCRLPCFAHLKTRSGIIDFTIKNVTINGQLFEDSLGEALQLRNYRMPEKMDYLHGAMSQCHEEEHSISCDLRNTQKDYSIIPIKFDDYDLLNVSNARDINVFYECVNNFRFANFSGNFYPIDEDQLKKCPNTMVVEAAGRSNIFSMHLTTKTVLKGSDFYIQQLFAEAPFNISGNTISISNLFNYTVDSGNYLWDGAIFRNLDRMIVNGNLTIINSSFMVNNLVVNNNLTLINCTIRQMSGRVTNGGQLNILNSQYKVSKRKTKMLIIEDGGLVNVDGTDFLNNIFHVDFTRFTMTRYETDERLANFELPISISSYDQVIGRDRWFLTSEKWIPLKFQTRHVIPTPDLPAFGSHGPIDYLDRESCTFFSHLVMMVCDYSKGRFFHYDFIDIYHNDTHQSEEFNPMLYMPWQGIYQNANILRIQTDIPKTETKVVFKDINTVIFHRIENSESMKPFVEASAMEFNNVSSPHFFSEVGHLTLNNSQIDFLTSFVHDEFHAFDSAIGLLSIATNRIYMDNVTITTLEMLMVDELAIIKNCHIGHLNSSAIISTDETKFRMINVTIGSMERESLILLDSFHLENVTINSATEDSILINSVLDSTMKNITVHNGLGEPFKVLSLETFVSEKILVNGKEYTPVSKGGARSTFNGESTVEKNPEARIQKDKISSLPTKYIVIVMVLLTASMAYTVHRIIKKSKLRSSVELEVYPNRAAVDINDLPNGLEILGQNSTSISSGGRSNSSNDTTVSSHSGTNRVNQAEPASSVQFHRNGNSSDPVNVSPASSSSGDEFVILPDDVTLVGGASANTGALYNFMRQTRNFFQRQ